MGHLYGFGNTLDKALTGVVGCKERGRQVDGPLDHSTGKGWVKDHAYGKGWVKTDTGWKWMGAQYYDAQWVKKAITRLVLVRGNFGRQALIAPPTKQFLHVFAKEAAGTNTDRTVYGAASASSFPPPSSSTTRSRSPWRRWRSRNRRPGTASTRWPGASALHLMTAAVYREALSCSAPCLERSLSALALWRPQAELEALEVLDRPMTIGDSENRKIAESRRQGIENRRASG